MTREFLKDVTRDLTSLLLVEDGVVLASASTRPEWGSDWLVILKDSDGNRRRVWEPSEKVARASMEAGKSSEERIEEAIAALEAKKG